MTVKRIVAGIMFLAIFSFCGLSIYNLIQNYKINEEAELIEKLSSSKTLKPSSDQKWTVTFNFDVLDPDVIRIETQNNIVLYDRSRCFDGLLKQFFTIKNCQPWLSEKAKSLFYNYVELAGKKARQKIEDQAKALKEYEANYDETSSK